MKRVFCLLALAVLLAVSLSGAAAAEDAQDTEQLLQSFELRHGDRSVKKVAVTVDDCYKNRRESISLDVELCLKYGVRMTFFPIVYTGCLEPQYRDIWQSVLDAGCEIGSHSWSHWQLGNRTSAGIIQVLGDWQQALDETLGYHYETRWLRPPYGSMTDNLKGNDSHTRVTKAIRTYGYEHVALWDVSQTDPDKALKAVKNGSIMLFHATVKDTKCLEKLIPALLEEGYELVTLSELFGFDPPETGGELYVFDREMYKGK